MLVEVEWTFLVVFSVPCFALLFLLATYYFSCSNGFVAFHALFFFKVYFLAVRTFVNIVFTKRDRISIQVHILKEKNNKHKRRFFV